MTIQKYYSLREIFKAEEQTREFLEYIHKILEFYPLLENMTMAEARDYIGMKNSLRELEIRKELDVE